MVSVRCPAVLHGDKVWSVVVRSIYVWSLRYDVNVVQVLPKHLGIDTRPPSSWLYCRRPASANERSLGLLPTRSVCLSVCLSVFVRQSILLFSALISFAF